MAIEIRMTEREYHNHCDASDGVCLECGNYRTVRQNRMRNIIRVKRVVLRQLWEWN